ncbi:MAG: glutathione S-transferase N-terminal domain-containing protein [Alphaproteobacteria bacterium]|nr:glutathione S-transferase N-terminal domain-containing protein [Alphaproteobacteria bacterium]
MIDLYFWPTPNGYKISIALEEMGLDYTVHGIDIGAGDQFDPEFLKIAPNNRIPAIIDHDGPGGVDFHLMESGAILLYLARKTGQFLPTDPVDEFRAIEWLMWQMGGVGPMFGQANHFIVYAKDKIDYAIDRYRNEVHRLCRVLNKRLGEAEYVAGEYTIADMAIFPWMRAHDRYDVDLDALPNVKRWFEAIDSRPAVQRGLAVLEERRRKVPMTDEQKEVMFGATQFKER